MTRRLILAVLTTPAVFAAAAIACDMSSSSSSTPVDASLGSSEAAPGPPPLLEPSACPTSTLLVPVRPLRILMVTKETLFHHVEAHDAGDVAVPTYLRARGHAVTVSNDSSYFAAGRLDPFDVVMFFVTSGNVVTEPMEQAELVRFVHSGRGIVGTHTASATNNDWLFMYQLMGATFGGHGSGDAQVTPARVTLYDAAGPLGAFIPQPWERTDEWYFYDRNPLEDRKLTPLLMLDESSLQQYRPAYPDRGLYGDAGHPLAWTQDFECSRVFYTALGHTAASYAEDLFLEHLAVGVEWAGAAASTGP